MQKIEKENVKGIFGLNMVQSGMLFHYLKEPRGNIYNVQLCLAVEGHVDITVLEKAFNQVQADNEMLRTVLRWEEVNKPVLIVLNKQLAAVNYFDISANTAANKEAFIEDYLAKDRNQRFDLTELPIRLSLIKTQEKAFIFCISHHHILYDGWSTGILLKELFQCYEELHKNQPHKLTNRPAYGDVYKELQKNDHLPLAVQYWREELRDYNVTSIFPDITDGVMAGGNLKKACFTVAAAALDSFSRKHKVTRSAVLYTAYGILLQRYSHSPDVIFGMTISSRDAGIAGHDKVIGNFINTVPLRIRHTEGTTLLEAVTALHTRLIEQNQFSNTSYGEIKQLLGLKPTDDLFDSVVVIENYPLDETAIQSTGDLKVKLRSVYENTGIPLLLTVYFREEVEFEFVYAEDTAHHFNLPALGKHFTRIVQEILNAPHQPVKSVRFLSEAEERQLVDNFNDTNASYPHNETIISLFEKQVQQTPDNIAIRYHDQSLTYRQLNDQANKIACHLKNEMGLIPGSLVGLMLTRDIYLIPCIWGILKAGGAYVPIDPHYPPGRILAITEDACLGLIITSSRFRQSITSPDVEILDLDEKWGTIVLQPANDLAVPVTVNDLAYIIYTSGSTGKPKGVMIEHRSVVNIIHCLHKRYPLQEQDTYLLKTNFTFDVSVAEIFGWFLGGGSLSILPAEHTVDMIQTIEAIDKHRITHINFVPSLFTVFLEELEYKGISKIAGLKYIFLAGEALPADLVRRFNLLQTGITLENIYGPTEGTIYSCAWSTREMNKQLKILIGKPLDNVQLYVLNDAQQLQPMGTAGELCISGDGLARGYWRNELLTAERFVENPFNKGKRMYRTGDLARWQADGNIEYLGRLDHQVKIRGFRIELGEIEQQLNQLTGIRETVVVVSEKDGNKYLVAYYVSFEEQVIAELKGKLQQQLPDYMIPNFFVRLSQLPLTPAGKIDRKALPDPEIMQWNNYTMATNEIEEKLVEIWASVLNVANDKISTNTNFFDIGGDSIKLISLSAKIRRTFGKEVSVTELFNYPTIVSLAGFLYNKDAAGKEEAEKKNNKEDHTSRSLAEDQLSPDIAVIGMAGRFPGAEDVDEFWMNLKQAKESITRKDKDSANEPLVYAKGILKDYDCFDEAFFNYVPAEAEVTDPQTRIFHECTWQALENAGYDPAVYHGLIGLYGGASANPYYTVSAQEINSDSWMEQWDAITYTDKDFLCLRTSYKLNLKGPSLNVTTACSTSLVAIDMACNDLLANKCEIAVAGGISITFHDNNGYVYKTGMILSPDGRCRAFDEGAAGTVGGNGVGVVVLKKLADALRDGDVIHAVIKGTATNNDGNEKIGFTAPGIEGQAGVIKKAIKNAGIPGDSISYIETHGTGTSLGDPIEIAGLTKAFQSDKKQFCAIGSVKTNIGHLDTAAGVAGFIKTVLALKHRQLPPSLHFTTPNPKIDFANSPFYVNTALKDWTNNGYPLRAGVSSFGIGGTNAHVILEEAPALPDSSPGRDYQLLLFSAKTPGALQRNINRFCTWWQQHPQEKPADIAYTLQTGRSSFQYRQMLVCRKEENVMEQSGTLQSTDHFHHLSNQLTPQVVFMFSGQGSQYADMCRGLYEQEPVFREQMDYCCRVIAEQYGKDLLSIIFSPTDTAAIDNTEYTQPALFIIEYSLARLLMSWGIRPDRMIGHSIGEYVAACISGVFSLDDALKLVVKRGELMQQVQPGKMLSVAASEEAVSKLLTAHPQVNLAAVNSSALCAVSGNTEAIAAFKATAEQAGFVCKPIRTSHAFHSAMMDEILGDYEQVVASVKLQAPQLPFISNVTGAVAEAALVTQSRYWVDHLRQPVQFAAGITTLFKNRESIFIEVGPGKVLSTLVQVHNLRQESHGVVILVRQSKETGDDIYHLLQGLGTLWLQGITINWTAFYAGERRHKVSLPGYSFEKTKYAVPTIKSNSRNGVDIQEFSQWFYTPTWKKAINQLSGSYPKERKTSLLFIDNAGIGEHIINEFRKDNEAVLTVSIGNSYKKENSHSYSINPHTQQDYSLLIQDIAQSGQKIDRIIHLWGISNDPDVSRDFYYYSILHIVQAIHQLKAFFGKELVVVTNGACNVSGDEISVPYKSMVKGILTVLPQEYPGYATKLIDVFPDEQTAGQKRDVETLYAAIKDTGTHKTICLRRGQQWVPIFDKVPYSRRNSSPAIREKGVYLITGGLGNVGFTLARHLLKKYQVKVILTGRRELNAEKLQKLAKLESVGGKENVWYVACNIADSHAVKKLVRESTMKYGQLHGVIHAAGITHGSSIRYLEELNKDNFEDQFTTKVAGLEVLADVLKGEKIDFLVATSSLSAILGGVEFAAYSSANIFTDHFIASKKETGEFENWISLNLDGIDFKETPGDSRLLNAAELCEAFEYALAKKGQFTQVIISKTDLHKRLEQWVETKEQPGVAIEEKNMPVNARNSDARLIHPDAVSIEKALHQLWITFLGKSSIGRDDNFFELGGDSMKALMMIGRIHKAFDIELSVKDFFNNPSIKDLSLLLNHVKTAQQGDIRTTKYKPIEPAARKDHYPLSSIQQRLYFLYQYEKQSLSYNVAQVFRITGILDKNRFSETLNALIKRHASLRTWFDIVNETPVQKVLDEAALSITWFETPGATIEEVMNDFVTPFDLSRAPLIRAGLLSTGSHEHYLIIDMPHIITDGISKDILIKEFISLYKGEVLPDLPLQYVDYAAWQQQEQEAPRIAQQRDFWMKEFEEQPLPIDLPTDYLRPSIKNEAGNVLVVDLSVAEVKTLATISEQEGVSLFMLFLAAYNVLLAKLSNQEDIVVGTPTAGRNHPDLERIVGLFVNTLPLRNYPRGHLTFKEFLAAVKTRSLISFENQDYQYEDLIEALHIDRNTSRNPLFDVWFMYQQRESAAFSIPELELTPVDYQTRSSRFDLGLEVLESGGRVTLRFEYATVLFREETIKKIIGYFREILSSISKNIQVKIADIDILSEKERQQLLTAFNDTKYPYTTDDTIISLFQKQAQRTPEEVAIVWENQKLTYQELDDQSSQLAYNLQSKYNVRPNDIIGIMAERSERMIISLLGILKSGAAYLPIDPKYPPDRIVYMLEDSEAGLLLLGEPMHTDIEYSGRIVAFEDIKSSHTADWKPVNRSADLCYVMYTSGSTGKPKGVKICHRNVVNFMAGMSRELPVGPDDCMLAVTSTSFDISVLELFWTICNGIQVVLHASDISMNGLDRYISNEDLSMDFSLFFFSSYNNTERNKYDLLIESVKYADEAGFKAVWTPERHFHEFGGLYPNPSVTSAALAMITKHIEIRSGSVVSPLHDPIRIAEEWSVIDNLSGGRTGISFASGWNPNDFALAKENYADRNGIMYKQIATIQRLWAGEKITRENGLNKEIEIGIYPAPIQKELPVWITSGGNEETFRSAGACGANLLTHLLGQDIESLANKIKLYREARLQHGYKPESGKVTIMLHAFIGDDEKEVEQLVEKPFTEYLKSSIGLNKMLKDELGLNSNGEVPPEIINTVLKNAFQRYYRTSSLIGTKSKCADMVLALKKTGVDEIACLIDFGVEKDKVLQGLKELKALKRLFAAGVNGAHRPVTMMQSTPSFIRLIDQGMASEKFLKSLRMLLIGGDMLPLTLIQKLKRGIGADIYNMYGPTETTIWSCLHKFEERPEKVRVGKPIANTQVYILNKHLQLVPVGVTGELYIGGDGLSAGYLNRPDLTAERFVANPFHSKSSLYKTGDIARWLPDGTIELAGRVDYQVKIRGFRIELGEIEHRLNRHEAITESAVIAREKDSDKYLVGYYVSDTMIDPLALRNFLQQELPDYMVPAFFVPLQQLPLTANGKLDRKSLPDPDPANQQQYVAAVTAEQQVMADIWQQVLGLDKIGISDNFFAIGGDSIKSIQIIARTRAAGYEVSVKDIFTSQTIEALAGRMKQIETVSDQSMVSGTSALTPIQQWFFGRERISAHHYNQSVMLQFAQGITASEVHSIFSKLQEHHDALRMVFRPGAAGWIADSLAVNEVPVSILEHDLRGTIDAGEILARYCNEVQGSIDLSHGPLMRLGLFHLEDGSRLLIVIHHLVVDGISWRILFEDIDTLYGQLQSNTVLSLPLKTDPFQQWPVHLEHYRESPSFQQAEAYWKNILDKPVLPLPRDIVAGSNRIIDTEKVIFNLSKEATTQLLTKAHGAFHTRINDLLLASLVMAIHEQFGIAEVKIDLESHGREDIVKGINISRTVGWFTSIYPAVLSYNSNGIAKHLKAIKEHLRKVPNNGLDYLLSGYGNVQEAASVMFNYLGQFDADTQGKVYSIAQEAGGEMVAGDTEREYDWNIVGMVVSGQLEMNLIYSREQYSGHTIRTFMQAYRDKLEAMIGYCCERTTQELTPSDLSYDALSMEQLDVLQQQYPVQDIYPLSPMQEGILFHSLIDENPELFLVQVSYDLYYPDLNIPVVEQSFRALMARYDVLRTIFIHEGFERSLQVVLHDSGVDFTYKDLRQQCREMNEHEAIAACKAADKKRKFDVQNNALIRLTVLQTTEFTYTFIWSYHHLLMDGWCMSIIINDFKTLYAGLTKGQPVQLPSVIPYSGYIKWLEGREKEQGLKYWQQYLEGYEVQATLPKDRIVSMQDALYRQDYVSLTLNKEETLLLKERAGAYRVTINTLLQVAWGILLSRYNNVNDVLLGSVVSGRPAAIAGIEDMVGLFINTIPVRVTFRADDTVISLLQRIQAEALESEPWHYYSLAEIQLLSPLGRGLLDHVLTFENYPIAQRIESAGKNEGQIDLIQNLEVSEQNNYHYGLTIIPGEDIVLKLDYNSNAYDKAGMEIVLLRLKRIVGQLVEDGNRHLSEIDILSEPEKHQLLHAFNNTQVACSKDKTIIDLFEEQVLKTPHHIAVASEDTKLTYQQLNAAANKLAHYLRNKWKVKPDDLVGVLLGRSEKLVISILAILKAGAAYLPIDPAYPDTRIQIMVENSALKGIITEEEYAGKTACENLIVYSNEAAAIDREPSDNPQKVTGPEDLFYVIYTSGSTGIPKGVMVKQHAVTNLVHWYSKLLSLSEQDCVLLMAPIGFDLTQKNFFVPLLNGARLYLSERLTLNYPLIADVIQEYQITVVNVAPSAFYPLLDKDMNDDYRKLSSLRKVVLGGEPINIKRMGEWSVSPFYHAEVINSYGPTECTDVVSYYVVNNADWGILESIPIGRPVDNTQLYILNAGHQLVPVGISGEIWIGGVGVSRGYLNNDQLTARKFIKDPFHEGGFMYSTGDWGKWLPDGNIDFAGRIDNQVKIRGSRIEPGEIEYQLNQQADIQESIVIAREKEGEKYLVAYYVAEQPLEATILRDFLLQLLPDYMVPSFFVHLQQFPLTPNGKLDRRSLPDPDLASLQQYIAPSNEMEEKLVELWANILRLDKNNISTHHRFFEMGGHSLKATLLANRIKRDFHAEIPLSDIFDKDVKTMADYIITFQQADAGFDQIENTIEITL